MINQKYTTNNYETRLKLSNALKEKNYSLSSVLKIVEKLPILPQNLCDKYIMEVLKLCQKKMTESKTVEEAQKIYKDLLADKEGED